MPHQRTANGTNRGPRPANEIKIEIRFAFDVGKPSIYNDSLIHRYAIRIRLKFYGGTEEKEEKEEEEEEDAQSSITLGVEDYETFIEEEKREREKEEQSSFRYVYSFAVCCRSPRLIGAPETRAAIL